MEAVKVWLEYHRFPAELDVPALKVAVDTSIVVVVTAAILTILLVRSLTGLSSVSGRKASVVQNLITRGRRSVKEFSGPAPSAAVDRALHAAIHAPNHWLSEPWRFRILGPQTAGQLRVLNAKHEKTPGFMVVSAVLTKSEDEKWWMKSLEEHAATAAAVQNFMLSLASEGVGSKWMTGAMGIPAEKIMEVAGADAEEEHFMGVIQFGLPGVPMSSLPVPTRKIGVGHPVVQRMA